MCIGLGLGLGLKSGQMYELIILICEIQGTAADVSTILLSAENT